MEKLWSARKLLRSLLPNLSETQPTMIAVDEAQNLQDVLERKHTLPALSAGCSLLEDVSAFAKELLELNDDFLWRVLQITTSSFKAIEADLHTEVGKQVRAQVLNLLQWHSVEFIVHDGEGQFKMHQKGEGQWHALHTFQAKG
jgi:hypothetical protein